MAPAANSDVGLTGIDLGVETDAGPPRSGRGGAREPANGEPERRCIATLERRPQGELIRFVLSPEGEVTPDIAVRLPGRGAWVTSSAGAIGDAVKKGAFARAFKAQARAPADLGHRVELLLVRRALDGLGLAKRAGDLILGFEQVREEIRAAEPACLIEASDGAGDGRRKVVALLHAAHASSAQEAQEKPNKIRVVGCFSADELGMALGRGRVIHACLKRGRFAKGWLGELSRLSGFRRIWPTDWMPEDGRPQLPAGGTES